MNDVLPKSSVSIVIPTYNALDLLSTNIPKIIEAAPDAEIIVVDDASTDGTVPFLRQTYPQIKVIAHTTNLRFAAACNSGVNVATHEIIVLLNNDVTPTPTFLDPLLQVFENPQVFAAGCREIQEIHGKKQISGRAGGRFKEGLLEHWRSSDQEGKTTFWVAGGSGAFRKSVWLKLGGMDTAFAPAYEEDRDICYRALKRGYKLVFVPQSEVMHVHETTNKQALGQRQMTIASYKNQLLFIWKNITSKDLIKEHVLWLPYHLAVTGYKSRGLFLLGFLKALTQVSDIRAKRQREAAESVLTDEAILAEASQI